MSSLSAGYHRHGHMSRRRAISEMLGVIILLSLTIVAGVLVYQIFTGKSNVASSATAISIQSATISGENGVMTVTVQNTGTSVINSINVTVYQSGSKVSVTGSFTPSSNVAPGQTASGTFTGSFTPGTQYTIVVTAATSTSTSGSYSTTTATAVVTAS